MTVSTMPPGAHDDVANAVAGALLAAHGVHKQRIRLWCRTGYWHRAATHVEIDLRTGRPIEPERTRITS